MGVSWSVSTETREEFEALRSEGAPEVHLTYSSSFVALQAAGFDVDTEDCWFSVDPRTDPDAVERLRAVGTWQADAIADVVEAAGRLGRAATAA
jgi:hypothetical protein